MDPMATTEAAVQVAHAADLSIIELVKQAGLFVKFIMGFLLLMSIITWAIWFSKTGQFSRLRRMADRFEEAFWGNQGLEDLYRNTSPEDTDHPMAKLFVIGLREFDRAKDKESEGHGVLQMNVTERIRTLLNANSIRELEKLEKSMPFLATVGSTAPFIGLLGTVWGIMTSFQSIGVSKNTSLAVVAPGIAEALLATALGLFAAIPAVMAYNKLSTEIGRYAARLEAFVDEFVSILERQQQEQLVSAKKTTKKRRSGDKVEKAS